jgi:hypothetical protein
MFQNETVWKQGNPVVGATEEGRGDTQTTVFSEVEEPAVFVKFSRQAIIFRPA